MRALTWDRLFYGCPGAWVGNPPVDGVSDGHITVDATELVDAFAYLRSKRVRVIGTRLSPGCPGGVQLRLLTPAGMPRVSNMLADRCAKLAFESRAKQSA